MAPSRVDFGVKLFFASFAFCVLVANFMLPCISHPKHYWRNSSIHEFIKEISECVTDFFCCIFRIQLSKYYKNQHLLPR